MLYTSIKLLVVNSKGRSVTTFSNSMDTKLCCTKLRVVTIPKIYSHPNPSAFLFTLTEYKFTDLIVAVRIH